ncbi:MAG: hypothetical protein MUO26_13475 [Methanotrichaceae archaeon]|nr:hypothetical protein [Methanotrichaceae archaeon]
MAISPEAERNIDKEYTDFLIGDKMILCSKCKHYLGLRKCKAFPKLIPRAIITGKHDHRKPYPEDNGILFKPKS